MNQLKMKLPIVKKAYKVFCPTVWESGDYYSNDDWEIVYAKTPGEAKTKCSEYDDYLNVKVKRATGADYILHEGQEIRRHALMERIRTEARRKERKEKVLKFPDTEMFYIQNGYVGNSCLWWGINNSSYTSDLSKAQKYTKDQVLRQFVNGRDEDRIWSATHVEQHIKTHVDSQYLSSEYEC